MLKYLVCFLLAAAASAVAIWFFLPKESVPQFTRAECVQRLKLVGLKGLEGEALSAREGRFFDSFNPIAMAGRDIWPISGLGFGEADRSEYYVRFWRDCDQKVQFTQALIERYELLSGDPIALEIDASPVILDFRKTVCFGGEHWIDGDEPC